MKSFLYPLTTLPLTLMALVALPISARAHGARLEYQTTRAIAIQAEYDSGEPMANASVVIYAPSDPSTPWQTGQTDEAGRFLFTPDPSQPGNWDIQVRQAGHGDIISIPIAPDATEQATDPNPAADPAAEAIAEVPDSQGDRPSAGVLNSNLSALQQGLLVGSVLWGCIGTALFFSRGKK